MHMRTKYFVLSRTRNKPIIFTLRKRGKPAYLYRDIYESRRSAHMRFDQKEEGYKEMGLLGAWVNRDGMWQNETTWDDYLKGLTVKVSEDEWHKDRRKDLHVECRPDSNGYKIIFTELDPNSGIILSDTLLEERRERICADGQFATPRPEPCGKAETHGKPHAGMRSILQQALKMSVSRSVEK